MVWYRCSPAKMHLLLLKEEVWLAQRTECFEGNDPGYFIVILKQKRCRKGDMGSDAAVHMHGCCETSNGYLRKR